jgi:hypothetical protein
VWGWSSRDPFHTRASGEHWRTPSRDRAQAPRRPSAGSLTVARQSARRRPPDPRRPSRNGDVWARRASIRHSCAGRNVSATAAGGRATARKRRQRPVERRPAEETASTLGAVQAAMLVVAGRSRAGGGSVPNGEHEHQLGQRGRRGPGCTARSRARAALLPASRPPSSPQRTEDAKCK